MFRKARPFFIKVVTPLHAGSGQDLGIVDLPIQRERHTDFPKIEGSGLKGSIREVFEENKENISKDLKLKFKDLDEEKYKKAIELTFGPESDEAHAGALGFTDARILLFPVKSMKGVFAWITCPQILKRFENELKLCFGDDLKLNWSVPTSSYYYSSKSVLVSGKVVLEEYSFNVSPDENIKKFANYLSEILDNPEIKDKVIYLPDDDFRDFVNLSTEVITRTKINNKTGTVENGALFTEEYLPAETIMYSLALSSPIFNSEKGIFSKKDDKNEEDLVMDFFVNGIPDVIQIGGNATIGKGIVEIKTMDSKK